MNTIGIIGAMDEEISGIKAKMEVIGTKILAGVEFFLGKLDNRTLVLARCGIGKVNAAVCSQVMIDIFGVDCIINAGVAGACSNELNVGDVVISDDLVHHDLDTSAFGDPIGTVPRMNMRFFTADEALVNAALTEARNCLGEARVFLGRIASGDQFVSDKDVKQRIWSQLKPLCVEMEGAAIAHVCALNHIPVVVIRSISDNSDGEADISFSEFIKTSSELLTNIVCGVIKKI